MNNDNIQIMPDLCSRKMPFNFVAALMLLKKGGVDLNKVHLKAVGCYENYKGEILGQEPKAGTELTPTTKIFLKVGKWSAVDIIPYQFFYGVTGSPKVSNEWEDNARNLMAPFDAAVIRSLAHADYEMLKFALSTIDNEHLAKFMKLFDFSLDFNATDQREIILWASLLPSFYYWSGNPEMVSIVLGFLFGYRFNIDENIPMTFKIPDKIVTRLGHRYNRLGSEFVLGGSFTENDTGYRIKVGEVALQDLKNWLPGKAKRIKLEKVLKLCMPDSLQYEIEINVNRDSLSSATVSGNSYLGISSFLIDKDVKTVVQQS